MTRIETSDTFESMFYKMSEGNPGALNVLMELWKESPKIDPDGIPSLGPVLLLDSLGVYGCRVWMLYKDVCKCDLPRTLALLRAWQLGLLGKAALDHAIDNYGKGIDVVTVCRAVKERLPNFNVSVE